jgi:hypothetical protein
VCERLCCGTASDSLRQELKRRAAQGVRNCIRIALLSDVEYDAIRHLVELVSSVWSEDALFERRGLNWK